MRSNSFVRRTIPCLAVVMAVTMPYQVAHAGFLDKLKSAAVTAYKSVMASSQGNNGSGVAGTTNASHEATIQKQSEVVQQQEVKTMEVLAEQSIMVAEEVVDLEKDLIQKVVKDVQNADKLLYSSASLRRFSKLEAEKISNVSTDSHTEIIPEYTESGLKFRYLYDEVALKNPQNIVKDMAILSVLTSSMSSYGYNSTVFKGTLNVSLKREIESPHAVAELLTNVKEGSPSAKARWIKIQVKILNDIDLNPSISQSLKLSSNTISEARQSLEADLPSLEEAANRHARKQQNLLEKWRSETRALDQLESMQEKLDDLILKNDRKGVRKLLEAYLPWSVMEPVEANTWKVWLEAIENPDFKNSTVAFRGLKYDTDKIQRRKTAQGEVYGFMSTVLTKNQGSYTRRLRSLSTNRVKNGDIGLFLKNSDILTAKITDQMTSHAKNPVASSFISFTYDPGIAKRFMGQDQVKVIKGEKVNVPYGGMLVVKVDSRRMIPNISSMYSSEIELLAPLIVFPDEVVVYKEGYFDEVHKYQSFIKEVSEKTGIDFTIWELAKDSNNEKLSDRYNREGHSFLKQIMDVKSSAKSCSKVF